MKAMDLLSTNDDDLSPSTEAKLRYFTDAHCHDSFDGTSSDSELSAVPHSWQQHSLNDFNLLCSQKQP